MPQVTVYIRTDDLPKWKAIEKKSQFLHDALNGSPALPAVLVKPTKPVMPIINVGMAPQRLQNGLCKEHGIPLDSRGKCLQIGCKYA